MTDVEGKFYKIIDGPMDGETGVCKLGNRWLLDGTDDYRLVFAVPTESGTEIYDLIDSAGTYKYRGNTESLESPPPEEEPFHDPNQKDLFEE